MGKHRMLDSARVARGENAFPTEVMFRECFNLTLRREESGLAPIYWSIVTNYSIM